MNVFERAVVLAEAAWARRHVTLAPEPPGERSGLITAGDGDTGAGEGRSRSSGTAAGHPGSHGFEAPGSAPVALEDGTPALRVVAVGDSMVAGCGTPHQSEGLVPDLAARLSGALRRSVAWQAVGRLGATMRRVRYRLLPQVGGRPDVLILCAGSNDVMARRTLEEWADDLDAALDLARERAQRVVVMSAGQPNRCPALPSALQGAIARAIDQQTAVSRNLCARRCVPYVDITHDPAPLRPGFWASDGFHPSVFGYRLVADAVVRRLPLPSAPSQAD